MSQSAEVAAGERVPGAGALLIALLVLVLVSAIDRTSTPGYWLDEELTDAVASALPHTGIPRLPSGVVYTRGLPYIYAASLAGTIFGHTLPAYRAVSLVFALAAVAALFLAGRTAGSAWIGLAAAGVLCASAP